MGDHVRGEVGIRLSCRRSAFADHLWVAVVALVAAVLLSLTVSAGTAAAAVIHEFNQPLTEALQAGVPTTASPAEASFRGPITEASHLASDGGHLWVDELIERGKHAGKVRVDEFNESDGSFIAPQIVEEGGAVSLTNGVAVGHAGGEEQIYVGGGQEVNGKGVPRVAVFGPSRKLQPQGLWTGANRPQGEFVAEHSGIFGIAVDDSKNMQTRGDVYVASNNPSGPVVSVFAGEAGGAEPPFVGQLTGTPRGPFGRLFDVAVSPVNGDVFVAEGSNNTEEVVDVFEPGGMPGVYSYLYTIEGPHEHETFAPQSDIAADGAGDLYVADQAVNVVYQFTANGVLTGQITGTPSGPFSSLLGLAVNPETGDVFVGDGQMVPAATIDAFGPSVVVPDVTVGAASGAEANTEGTVEATLNGTVNPDGEGAASCGFVWGETAAFGQIAACEPGEMPEGGAPVPVQARVKGLAPDTSYTFRLQASDKNGSNPGEAAQDETFVTPGPGVDGAWSSEVASTSATLNASIDPDAAPTSYYFQYGTSSAYEQSVPAAPEAIGDGVEDVSVSPRHLQELAPETTYHFRVVAVSTVQVKGAAAAVSFTGPDRTFTTQPARTNASLPDGRQWELVSPPDKHGATIGPINSETNAGGLIEAAANGDAITYVTSQPTEETAKGYEPKGVQVLSSRSGDGWRSQDLSLPHTAMVPFSQEKEYVVFSADLSAAVVEPLGRFTSLAPEVFPADTERTPYIRHDSTCTESPHTCFEPIATAAPGYADVPEGTKFGDEGNGYFGEEGQHFQFKGGVRLAGATSDLSKLVVRMTAPLPAPYTSETLPELYEFSPEAPPTERLQMLSWLPPNEKGEVLPAKGATEQGPKVGTSESFARNPLSPDGSRVVFSAATGNAQTGEPENHLFLRDVPLGQTIQLDAAEPACVASEECEPGGNEGPQFQVASVDDSRIFFTDTRRLTSDSSRIHETPDLYECKIVEAAGHVRCELSDLTPAPGPDQAAEVNGLVIGASEDGSWLYFVANGVLGDAQRLGATAGHCESSGGRAFGECNLYVWHEGVTHLIATLPGQDFPDWAVAKVKNSVYAQELIARVSPDGRWLAFMSERSLTGYDNRDLVDGKPDEEVFLYHADESDSGNLVCASCDPSGARPVGVERGDEGFGYAAALGAWEGGQGIAANLPGWPLGSADLPLHQPRYLSDSGRLFFDSSDALVPGDVNGNEDVYEWEPVGVGSCSGVAAGFSSGTGGCVALISSGRGKGESAFMDASEDGDDVFFVTFEKLVPADVDSAVDMYDAHVCSAGSPCVQELAVPEACATADACRAAPSPQPSIFGAPASATFSGPGNHPPVPPSQRAVVKLTRAQELSKALQVCRSRFKHSGRRRAACEVQARRRFGARPKVNHEKKDARK
jgi:hypothetical protein